MRIPPSRAPSHGQREDEDSRNMNGKNWHTKRYMLSFLSFECLNGANIPHGLGFLLLAALLYWQQ